MLKKRVRRHYFLPMSDKVQEAIDNFMSNLTVVNDLHHPNDERRLYNIALEAVRASRPIPRDEMRSTFDEAVRQQNLNSSLFEEYFPKYLKVLERTYDILSRIHKGSPIVESFRF